MGLETTESRIRSLYPHLHRGLSVLDLREGEWRCAADSSARHSKAGQEFLAHLMKQDRIVSAPKAAAQMIGRDDDAWHREASRLAKRFALCAFIQSEPYDNGGNTIPPRIVATEAGTHIAPEPSSTIHRTAEGWASFLREIALRSSKIEIIDPYLDPRSDRYQYFGRALADAVDKTRQLKGFDVHFHCQPSDEGDAQDETTRAAIALEWSKQMASTWGAVFRKQNIRAQTTLWDDLRKQHDRYLLAKNFGLFFSNGFDVSYSKNMEKRVEASFLNSGRFEEVSKRHSYHAYKHESRCRGHFTFGAA